MPSQALPREKTWTKPLAGILLTTSATWVLLWSDRSNWTNAGQFYEIVTGHRASSQIVVQLLSHALGAIYVYISCTLINLATRLRLCQRPMTLDHLTFWNALCGVRLDWSLPFRRLIPLTLFFLLGLLPGAIWAGALTPIVTSTSLTSSPSRYYSSSPKLKVPQYSAASATFWQNLTWLEPMPSIRSDKGIFTYSPNYDLQDLILNAAASATSRDGTAQNHSKIDNSRYSYTGRSFGVGSSAGLVADSLNSLSALSYSYNETGYRAQVGCIMNTTSNWTISDYGFSQDGFSPNIYIASGTLPNGASDFYAACGLASSDQIAALIGHAFNGQNIFAIAAGQAYNALNGVQCNVTFSPAAFTIDVDTIQLTIAVTPLVQQAPVIDIEPSGSIIAITMRMPTSFSQQNACDLYTSSIGNTLKSNIENIDSSWNSSADPSASNQIAGTLKGVEDSLTSMLDNVLLSFSMAQLMIADDAHEVTTSSAIKSLRIGEPAYIYAIAALNFFVLLLFLGEATRTKGWRDLKPFDYTNIKSVVVGTSMGGTAVADATREAHALKKTTWNGRADDAIAGRVAVRLENQGEDLALMYDHRAGVRSSKSSEYELLVHAEGIAGAGANFPKQPNRRPN